MKDSLVAFFENQAALAEAGKPGVARAFRDTLIGLRSRYPDRAFFRRADPSAAAEDLFVVSIGDQQQALSAARRLLGKLAPPGTRVATAQDIDAEGNLRLLRMQVSYAGMTGMSAQSDRSLAMVSALFGLLAQEARRELAVRPKEIAGRPIHRIVGGDGTLLAEKPYIEA